MARVNISELHLRVTGSSKGLASAIFNANRQIERFRDRIRRINPLQDSFANFNRILGRTIALYAAFNAFDFARQQLVDAVKLAADAELAEISLETLLGSAEDAKRVLADLYDFVETTPFRLTEVRDSAQLLAAFGVETEKILPTLRSLGDIAAGINQPIRELADLYGRTLNEQRLYTRDLNQFTSRGIPLIQEFAKTFGVAENEVRGLAEAGALMADDVTDAIARMTSEGGRFFGLTEKQAQTTAGEFSNFLDEVDALKREFGTGMLPVLKGFLQIAREMVGVTGDGKAAMQGWREAGEEFADWLKFGASIVQGFRLEMVFLLRGITLVFGAFEDLARFVTRANGSGFFDGVDAELAAMQQSLTQSIRRLWDMEQQLKSSGDEGKKFGKGLAEAMDLVPLAVRRAQNELKRLTAAGVNAAEKLRKEFRTPLEKFREAAENIANARLLGGLDEDVARRALQSEIDRLTTAKEELQKVQQVGALRRGSQEEIAARNQRFLLPVGNGVTRRDAIEIFNQIFRDARRETSELRQNATSGEIRHLRDQQASEAKQNTDGLRAIHGALQTLIGTPAVQFEEATA